MCNTAAKGSALDKSCDLDACKTASRPLIQCVDPLDAKKCSTDKGQCTKVICETEIWRSLKSCQEIKKENQDCISDDKCVYDEKFCNTYLNKKFSSCQCKFTYSKDAAGVP